MCYLRREFAEQFADFTGADRIYSRDTRAFYFDNINAEDVKVFLLKQAYKSHLLLYETMDIFVWPAVPRKPSSQPIWLKV